MGDYARRATLNLLEHCNKLHMLRIITTCADSDPPPTLSIKSEDGLIMMESAGDRGLRSGSSSRRQQEGFTKRLSNPTGSLLYTCERTSPGSYTSHYEKGVSDTIPRTI
jgi:hypothetical protein